MLRNRRTIIFALVFPAAMFFVFGSGSDGAGAASGAGNVVGLRHGVDGDVRRRADRRLRRRRRRRRAGARLVAPAAPDAAAPDGLHPGQGVRRPRHGRAARSSPSTSIGAVQGKPQMPFDVWVKCGLLTLACVMTFAALGVFVGYLVPGENVMQVLGPGLALLAFLGGLFIPLSLVQPDRARHRLLDTDVRRRRGGARAADPGAALVRRGQRGRLAGDLRARRRVADEQGHRAGVTASVTTMTRNPDPLDAGRPALGDRVRRHLAVLPGSTRSREAWAHARHRRRRRRWPRDASSSAPST